MNPYVREAISMEIVKPKILYFGTPVVLLTTLNHDGSTNITPMSSAWALGDRVVLGLAQGGQGLDNLGCRGECVINIPSAQLWKNVEALAPLTGANPVPENKREQFHYEPDKFGAASFSGIPAQQVGPLRIAECPLQIEAALMAMHSGGDAAFFAIIETRALLVHAHSSIVRDQTHIDPAAWHPLIYNFRHYFGLGEDLGSTFRAEI